MLVQLIVFVLKNFNMLINLTNFDFNSLPRAKQESLEKRFGSILDIHLPVIFDELQLEDLANDFFVRITAAIDSCANEPKENAVCMHIATALEKKIMSMLIASKINVLLNCWD